MTDAFTAASGCKLLPNADGSVMEVVLIETPTEASECVLRRLTAPALATPMPALCFSPDPVRG